MIYLELFAGVLLFVGSVFGFFAGIFGLSFVALEKLKKPILVWPVVLVIISAFFTALIALSPLFQWFFSNLENFK